MKTLQTLILISILFAVALPSVAQETDPDGWKMNAGLSYVATTGNSETSSAGLSFDAEWLRSRWTFDSGVVALRARDEGVLVAEQYKAFGRASRAISERLSLTTGWQGERNRFAGLDFRSTADLGMKWKAVDREKWTASTIGSLTWIRENPVGEAPGEGNLGGLLELKSEYQFSENASTEQIVRFEPDFEDSANYRFDVKLTLESALTQLFAIKLGYNYRYDNQPIPGYSTTDTTTTASLVFKIAKGALAKP